MRQHRSVVLGVLALAAFALGLGACASETSKQAAGMAPTPTTSQLAGTWRGTGRVWDLNGPIEIKIDPDGSFTGSAAGNPIRGNLKTTDGLISFDSSGPRGGATGTMSYRESGGQRFMKVSATGKSAGQPIDFELVKQ